MGGEEEEGIGGGQRQRIGEEKRWRDWVVMPRDLGFHCPERRGKALQSDQKMERGVAILSLIIITATSSSSGFQV